MAAEVTGNPVYFFIGSELLVLILKYAKRMIPAKPYNRYIQMLYQLCIPI